MCAFRVSSPKQILEHILPHFDKYPLITQKSADFLLFKIIVQMMLNREHLNEEGLQEIVNIRASLNLGLSNVLKSAFPDTIPVSRPLVTNQLSNKIPHPQWVSGFVTGEGCFFIKNNKRSEYCRCRCSNLIPSNSTRTWYWIIERFYEFF